MLDDNNVLKQRDPSNALGVARNQPDQALFEAAIERGEHDNRRIQNVVVAGMGGSALAALFLKHWLKNELDVPFEIVRGYDLPGYVGPGSLVIASSYSGNTEETLSCLTQATERGSEIAVAASGGKLTELAEAQGIAGVRLPSGLQPRMATLLSLRALTALLVHFGIADKARFDEIAAASSWLHDEVKAWLPETPTGRNLAKQLAVIGVGRTPVFYSGNLMVPVAYKWKISWNETAKNVAFWNEYPEFNHNEFMGWSSHPVEKPFAVFDLLSSFEHPRILKRFELSGRLLSGMRPEAQRVDLVGDSVIKQMLWGSILADFVSIYAAVLNGVDPTPVALIEKLKTELDA